MVCLFLTIKSAVKNFYFTLLIKDPKRYSNNKIFVASVYVANFIRDILSSVLEIVFNYILIYCLKRFYYDKIRVTGRPDEVLSHVEKTNTFTAIIICSLSLITHIVTFLVKNLYFYIIIFPFKLFFRMTSGFFVQCAIILKADF